MLLCWQLGISNDERRRKSGSQSATIKNKIIKKISNIASASLASSNYRSRLSFQAIYVWEWDKGGITLSSSLIIINK
jgi:hypothetical protein